jgi:hypothetical protein
VDVGTPAVSRSLLVNTGTLAWSLTIPTAASVAGDGFSFVSTSCGTSLPAAGTCEVYVKFDPATAGIKTGYLQLQTSLGTYSANLTGSARKLSLSSSPASLNFGPIRVGSSSAVSNVTLQNTGSEALTVAGIGVVGASSFAQNNNCGSLLSPGATCTVNVQFSPTERGTAAATLSAVVDGVSPVTVSLTGNGILGIASVAPTSLDFGSQWLDVATAAQPITLTNTGDDTLTVSSVTVSSGAADFSQTNNCSSVPANGSCTISATFKPTTSGARTGTISIQHNGQGSTTTVALNGSGSASTLNVGLSKTSVDSSGWQHYALDFGNTGLNAAATPKTFTLSASGASVSLSSVAIYTGNPEYSVSHNCGSTLAAGTSCTVTVNLTPYVAGTRVGTIRVISNQGTSVIDLTTNAQSTTATATPSAGLTFSSTLLGATSTAQSVTVNNTGDYPLSVTNVAFETGSTDFVVQSNGCSAVAAHSSCTISVAFAPSAAGTRSGSLAITNNSSTAKLTVPVSGTGTAPTFTIGLTKTTVDGSGWQHYSLNFGASKVNVASTPQLFTITAGSTPVTFSMLGIYTGNPEYTVTHTCGTGLAAGASCTVTVKLTPFVAGTRIGTIRIFTNIGNNVVDLTTSATN